MIKKLNFNTNQGEYISEEKVREDLKLTWLQHGKDVSSGTLRLIYEYVYNNEKITKEESNNYLDDFCTPSKAERTAFDLGDL